MNIIEIITCYLRDRFSNIDISSSYQKTIIEAKVYLDPGYITWASLWIYKKSATIVVIDGLLNSYVVDLASPNGLDDFDAAIQECVENMLKCE